MIRFDCDYLEGAHPQVLQLLLQTNLEQLPGYSEDHYCAEAQQLIKDLCHAPNAQVHFLVGGTQTNATVIKASLRPHQGVITAASGHINVHESGAIEAGGHKVLTLPSSDGKVSYQQVEKLVYEHWNDENHEHMVQPGMVYISHPTECGTLYSLAELQALHRTCSEHSLYLYLDGARLGYGLTADTDLTLEHLAQLCDLFYIGGTKVGALFGEALVISRPELQRDFRCLIKQNGGLLAKGRLLGLQFLALLRNGLYWQLGKQANLYAQRLHSAFEQAGFSFYYDSSTNQQFPIISNTLLEQLRSKYTYSFWCPFDDKHSVVRFCTSWATTEEQIASLEDDLEKLIVKPSE